MDYLDCVLRRVTQSAIPQLWERQGEHILGREIRKQMPGIRFQQIIVVVKMPAVLVAVRSTAKPFLVLPRRLRSVVNF
jgi:hypothetical protein